MSTARPADDHLPRLRVRAVTRTDPGGLSLFFHRVQVTWDLSVLGSARTENRSLHQLSDARPPRIWRLSMASPLDIVIGPHGGEAGATLLTLSWFRYLVTRPEQARRVLQHFRDHGVPAKTHPEHAENTGPAKKLVLTRTEQQLLQDVDVRAFDDQLAQVTFTSADSTRWPLPDGEPWLDHLERGGTVADAGVAPPGLDAFLSDPPPHPPLDENRF
ncbi:hypothetical protein [Kineosporia succinea]|uniref:Uncharacterized protein n=1 Tax=Kineosporia succinea TaxID=84632 RepID=A0ABT9P5S3_9ACTN|nr:hypothetical protein [Kineosporia succinea]MDP9827420.1 hypothetical protein [Kineosporia succinea]